MSDEIRLILVNYTKNYEIEQLSRMFFKKLSVDIADRRDRSVKNDLIYIRRG